MRLLLIASRILLAAMTVSTVHADTWKLKVPCDHFSDENCHIALSLESGRPIRPELPTILVVTDGQQFSARPGGAAQLQQTTFGDDVNVIMYWGRASSADILTRLKSSGSTDWQMAYRYLGARQWVEDLHIVQRFLRMRNSRLAFFGTSGGAYLIHQYFATYPFENVRAFTSAPVSPEITAELGISTDHFQETLDAGTRELLSEVLRSRKVNRQTVAKLLQRQNFFVSPEQLSAQRNLLLSALRDDDGEKVARFAEEYQVNAVKSLLESDLGIAVRVRIFEFVAYLPDDVLTRCKLICPDIEQQLDTAAPLLKIGKTLHRLLPRFDRESRARSTSSVFILLGRHDHTVDYRAGIALAMQYPQATLFIVDSDHVFSSIKKNGVYSALIRQFFIEGSETSAEIREQINAARWRE